MSDRACIQCGNTTGHDLIGGACITCDFGTCDDCDTLRAECERLRGLVEEALEMAESERYFSSIAAAIRKEAAGE